MNLNKDDLKREKAKPLDENEMLELVDHKARIVLYSDLHRYNDLADLLKPHGAIFLLYQQQPNYGHWTVLFRRGSEIEFFDPYSYMPDDQLKWTKPEMRKKLNMDYPYLTKLLYDAPSMYSISYNEHKFQKHGDGINTCGRWCAARLAARNLTLKEFVEKFDMKSKTNDNIITEVTTFKD